MQFAIRLNMTIDADMLKALIEQELRQLSDTRVIAHARGLLIESKVVIRGWDYGEPWRCPCWDVLHHDESSSAVAYCESGCGARCPWGLVGMESAGPGNMSMGMDSGWFSTFLDAFFGSFALTTLAIWRVFQTDSSGVRKPLTGDGSWETTWKRVAEYRQADRTSLCDCDHSIAYGP
jgi:hypothetical protein